MPETNWIPFTTEDALPLPVKYGRKPMLWAIDWGDGLNNERQIAVGRWQMNTHPPFVDVFEGSGPFQKVLVAYAELPAFPEHLVMPKVIPGA